jgi:hypothetical protein
VLKGQAEDMVMRTDDILFVPHSTMKEVGKQALATGIAMAAGILVYRAGGY